MYTATAILMLFLTAASAQQPDVPRSLTTAQEQRVQSVIAGLDSGAPRGLLEQGVRGDGVRKPWMDLMQRFGIREVLFTVEFDWRPREHHIKIARTAYLTAYYRYDSDIRDKSTLARIRDAGVEQTLSKVIIRKAEEEEIPGLFRSGAAQGHGQASRLRGVLYLTLLDDEALPELDGMPELK
jgi:hypothetical protein